MLRKDSGIAVGYVDVNRANTRSTPGTGAANGSVLELTNVIRPRDDAAAGDAVASRMAGAAQAPVVTS